MNKLKKIYKWGLESGIIECILAVAFLLLLGNLIKGSSSDLLIALIVVNTYLIRADIRKLKNKIDKN